MSSSEVLENSAAMLTIDLSAITRNYQTLNNQSSGADCAAVVKANAYGLGMDQVAPAIFNHTNCKTFFVANLIEAVALRKLLPTAIIYVFNGLFTDQVETFIEHDIRPILNDLIQISLWDGCKHPCAIHFDTGINRLGLSKSDTDKFLNNKNNLNVSLVLSHLVRSEQPQHDTNKIQLETFKKITNELSDTPASLANSGGIYLGPDYHFDMVRPGIMLYGGNPGLDMRPGGLKDTIEIKAKILQIRHLSPGMSVGYDAIWTAEKSSRIALLNVGYADGTLKSSDKTSKVFLGGEFAPVIGKVSMDMIAIDISETKFDTITVTDFAEIIGSNITLEMASEVSTLGQYELLTGIGQRYTKNYKSGTLA